MAVDFSYGVRFHPTESETMDLLLLKVAGVPLLSHDFIRVADFYGDREPWEIFGDSDSSEKIYFFSKAKKIVFKNQARWSKLKKFSRGVGRGRWMQTSDQSPIRGEISWRIGGVEGCKRNYRYVRKQEGGDQDFKGTWLMAEYSFPDDIDKKWPVKGDYKDCVICVLKMRPWGKDQGPGTDVED